MHRGEDQFDGPFGGEALGFERIGEAQTADGQIGSLSAGAVQLQIDILPFGQGGAWGDEVEIGADDRFVNKRRSDFEGRHAAFAGEETGQWNFELAVGEEKERLASEGFGGLGNGFTRPGARGGGDCVKCGLIDAKFGGDGGEPSGCAFFAKGEGGGQVTGAAPFEGGVGVAKKGLDQGKDRVWPDSQIAVGARRGQDFGVDPHLGQQVDRLIFDHVGQRANQQELACVCFGQHRDHRGKAGVFALGEGGFDPGAGEVQHPH